MPTRFDNNLKMQKTTTNIIRRGLMAASVALGSFSFQSTAQQVALKTNLLYDALLSPTVGVEVGVAPKWTIDLSATINNWAVNDHRWKQWMVQPEARYWFCQPFSGHFVGVHALGGQYNFGNLKNDIKFLGTDFSELTKYRKQGWMAGLGVAYGYSWILSPRWNLEAELGIGWIYTKSDTYRCANCGKKVKENEPHHYFGPTKASINLVYTFSSMKQKLSTLFGASTLALSAAAAKPVAPADPEIYSAAVAVDEQQRTLSVDIELHPENFHIGRNSEQVFTPVIISAEGTDSLRLDPIRICGRNRWYYYLRNGELGHHNETPHIFRAGVAGNALLSQTVELQPWMENSTVELRRTSATCCSHPELLPGTSPRRMTEIARINTRRPELIEEYVFAPPVEYAPVEKNIEGSAFVSFVVNRTELKPDYMVNRREISKIINSIDYVRNDSDAIITGIHIKGFASPEGSYSNNIRLAKGRTETLTQYVRDYSRSYFNLPDSIFSNSFEPEDWQGLRRYVADSLQFNISNREEILAMIDSPMDPDVKNDLLKRTYPADYKVILEEIYPWLRHSDYTVHYLIKIYTDLKDLNRLFNTDPTRLRPVDFYTVAAQYEEGSDDYNRVMLKAVEVYPNNRMINLNAANIALQANDIDLARHYLTKAGNTPQADFAHGVIAAREGNYGDALAYFSNARDGGIEKAEDYIKNIESIQNHIAVQITVITTRQIENN